MASLIKGDQFTTGCHLFNFIRMSVKNVEELHSRIEPMIKKRHQLQICYTFKRTFTINNLH